MAGDSYLVERLAAVALFAGLKKKELKQLADRMRIVEYSEGQEILEQGRSGVGFHLILDGRAAVNVGGQHRADLGPGQHFGEISLIDGKPRSAAVMAASPLRTASMTAWEFGPLLEENPTIAIGLLKYLCARLRAAESAPAQ